MITVSEAYKAAINADMRYIVPKVLVYFDGDASPPVEFGKDDIVDIYLLEEAGKESASPIGIISSNELTISFKNEGQIFTPTNTSSPFYGKLRPNIKVEPYLSLETSPGVFEQIPLGVFWTNDWDAPSNALEAKVICYDRLFEIGNRDIPMLRVMLNTTVYDMFETLFVALGLRPGIDFYIDPSLKIPVKIGWFPEDKVKSALQVLAEAGNCNVTADRYGKIRVLSNFRSSAPATVFSDNDQIINANNPQRYLNIYNAVRLNYRIPYIKPTEQILKVESLTIPRGGAKLQNLKFNNGPIASVDSVKLLGAKNAEIVSVKYGAWMAEIEIANNGSDETVSLEIYGKPVATATSSYAIQDTASVERWGFKELSIDNPMMQDINTVRMYADALLYLVNDPFATFSLEVRGDMAIEIGDIIRIVDNVDKIGVVDVTPTRISLAYDGALSATIDARKPIVPYQWMFISPGLYGHLPYIVLEPHFEPPQVFSETISNFTTGVFEDDKIQVHPDGYLYLALQPPGDIVEDFTDEQFVVPLTPVSRPTSQGITTYNGLNCYYLAGQNVNSSTTSVSINVSFERDVELRFLWAVSSETNYDWLQFYLDGVEKDRISGEVTWQEKTYTLSAGSHQLEWRYTKDGSVSRYNDAGYIANLRFLGAIPPKIYSPRYWISQEFDLSSAGPYKNSWVVWDAFTPTNTSVTVEMSLNDGPWRQCIYGQPLPGLSLGDDLTGVKIKFLVTLAGNSDISPTFGNLTFTIERLVV